MNRGNERIKTPLNYREGGIHILRLVNGYLDFIPPQLPPAERVAHQTGKMSQPKVAVQRSIRFGWSPFAGTPKRIRTPSRAKKMAPKHRCEVLDLISKFLQFITIEGL